MPQDLVTVSVLMMGSDRDWPNLLLPVKNAKESGENGFPKIGYMLEPAKQGYGPVTIYLGNMFDVDPAHDEKKVYPTVGDAVLAGWRVD